MNLSLIKKLEELKVNKSIRFAFLFGSEIYKTDKYSDIDIGVFLDTEIDSNKYFRKRLEIIADIADIIERDDIDLVILNEDNVTINHEVITKGKLIFERDFIERIDYEALIISKWMDWKRLMDIWRDGFDWQMERDLIWQ